MEALDITVLSKAVSSMNDLDHYEDELKNVLDSIYFIQRTYRNLNMFKCLKKKIEIHLLFVAEAISCIGALCVYHIYSTWHSISRFLLYLQTSVQNQPIIKFCHGKYH